MCHIDRTIADRKHLMDLAQTGCYLEYDLFGLETSYYPYNPDFDMPNDGGRMAQILRLIEDGHARQVLMSHDIAYKHCLTKWGGFGYHHLLVNVLPRLRRKGADDKIVQTLLIDNPRRAFRLRLRGGREGQRCPLARSSVPSRSPPFCSWPRCCSPSPPHSPAAEPAGEVTVSFHVTFAPCWFDPTTAPPQITPFGVMYAIHDALVRPLPGQKMGPSLAESWTESKDGLVYEFKLRRGLKFHNGDPLTAEDVK